MLIILLAFSILIRLVLLTHPNQPVFDELNYLPYIQQYLNGTPSFLPHPPLGVIIMGWGVEIFGDSPLGWRIVPVLMATIGVWLTYLLAFKITRRENSALYAAAFLSFSPLWFTISRIAMLDIIMTVLLLGAVYSYLNKGYWIGAVFAGLALSTKWVALFPLALIYGLIWLDILRNRQFKVWDCLKPLCFPLIAVVIYFGISACFFKDFNPAHLVEIQKTILKFQAGIKGDALNSSPAWSWYLIPQFIPCFNSGPGWFDKIAIMENPALLWWGIVSAGLVLERIIRRKVTNLCLPWLLWLSLTLPFFFYQRPLYLYYLIPALPFLYIMSGEMLEETAGQSFWSKAYLGFVILSFFYLYPQLVMK